MAIRHDSQKKVALRNVSAKGGGGAAGEPDAGSPNESRGSAVDDLFSGRLPSKSKPKKRPRSKEKTAEILPGELQALADVVAASRRVEKEVEFKRQFAEQRVRDYCVRRFAEKFAESGIRPEGVPYIGKSSRFTYVQTRRINITPEKAAVIRDMGVPIDDYTTLRGIRINYRALREHGLEPKLRDAVAAMGLPPEVVAECFEPAIELKDAFFEHLSAIVKGTLPEGVSLEERLYEVIRALEPAGQIRNAETPELDAEECFKLILDTEITADLDEVDLDAG